MLRGCAMADAGMLGWGSVMGASGALIINNPCSW